MQRKTLLLSALGALLIAAAGGAYFHFANHRVPPANALMVIEPYRTADTWVFDDAKAGLVKEPFIAGVPAMIDTLVRDIPDAKKGFRLLFSAQPFPGFQKKLTWTRSEMGGAYYAMQDPAMEGWLCPALFKYFNAAPKELYVKAEAK